MILDIDVPPRVWPWLQVQTTSGGAEQACAGVPDPFTGLELLPDAVGLQARTLPLLRAQCAALTVEAALLRRGAVVVNAAGRVGVVVGAYRVAQPAGRRFGMCATSPAWWVEGLWPGTVTETISTTPGPPITRQNLATNPVPASTTGWVTNSGTGWAISYAAGEVLVDRLVAAGAGLAASLYNLGGISPVANPVLPLGVAYQRSVEVWVDAAGSMGNASSGGFVGGQALPANTWTRVVQQFLGEGVARYPMNVLVTIPGVGTGVHVKLRRAQLIVNPTGLPLPYFDGDTPAGDGWTYKWDGTANASTSTATRTAR